MSVLLTTQRVEFPELQHHWSTDEGNYHAPYRDKWRGYEHHPFGFDYDPRPDGRNCGLVIGYVTLSSRVPASGQRLYSKLLSRPTPYPKRGEIEFSAPAGSSLPERYKRSAVRWALSISDAVLVAIDRQRGLAEGEAHAVLSQRQCVFRCAETDVDTWVAYLRPKLLSRHKEFAVVHLPDGRA